MLEIKGISKSFGSQSALDEVNLVIQPGEFFSLLGPSGCGKTTLLRILGGFEVPSSGEIWLDGKRVDHSNPRGRLFNMVFQRYALFPHLSVWENIAFGLKVKKVDLAEIKTRVSEVLALMKMEALADRAIYTLSGGQQQRIALARALVNRPKVLLLDEPLSALDLKLRQQMQIELCALQRRLNITFIFVTHDQEEALRMSDRIAVMNHGHLEQIGTPHEIYEYPKTPFVADFIGTINVVSGVVGESSPNEVSLRLKNGQMLYAQPSKDGRRQLMHVAAGEKAVLMVRPENLYIAPKPFEGSRQCIPGLIKEVLYKGQVTEILVEPEIPGMGPLMVSEPNGSPALEQNKFDVGSRFFVTWDADDAFIMKQPNT